MLSRLLDRARNERASLGYVTDATRLKLAQLGVTSPEMESFFAGTTTGG